MKQATPHYSYEFDQVQYKIKTILHKRKTLRTRIDNWLERMVIQRNNESFDTFIAKFLNICLRWEWVRVRLGVSEDWVDLSADLKFDWNQIKVEYKS